MTLSRTRPDFDTEDTGKSIVLGGFIGLISLAMSGFGVIYLRDGVSSRKLGEVLVGLYLCPVGMAQAFMCIKGVGGAVSALVKRHSWFMKAAHIQARILDKRADDSIDYEVQYDLGLELTLPQATVTLDERCIWARVDERVYDRYASGDIVTVYYLPSSPLTFLIDGE